MPYIVVKANANSESTGTLRYCEVNFTSYSARTKQLAGIKVCNSFYNALSTDMSSTKIGVCYQELSYLEFNFHCWYSRTQQDSRTRLCINIIYVLAHYSHPVPYIQIWNDELATVAQNYAEGCVFRHNPNRSDLHHPLTMLAKTWLLPLQVV